MKIEVLLRDSWEFAGKVIDYMKPFEDISRKQFFYMVLFGAAMFSLPFARENPYTIVLGKENVEYALERKKLISHIEFLADKNNNGSTSQTEWKNILEDIYGREFGLEIGDPKKFIYEDSSLTNDGLEGYVWRGL